MKWRELGIEFFVSRDLLLRLKDLAVPCNNLRPVKRLSFDLSLLFRNPRSRMGCTIAMKDRLSLFLALAMLLWGASYAFSDDTDAQEAVGEAGDAAPADVRPELGKNIAGNPADSERFRVYVIPIQDAIGRPTLFAVRSGIKDALETDVDLVLFEMDTPGGELGSTLEIMKAIDRFDGKTATFINEEAISAGAIIASVTQDIYFMPRATMGSSEVVTGTGQDVDESMKRKINAFLTAKIDAYINEYPYRSQVLEAMVDPDIELVIDEKVISKEGKLLNLNARTAHEEYGDPPRALLGSGIHDDMDALLESLADGKEVERIDFEATWSLSLAARLMDLSPVLLGLGILLLLVEFRTPGFGVFGVAGVAFIAIVNFGHHVAGLSGYEGLIVFIIGACLVFVELVFMPGVLFLAVPGALMMLGGLLWSMADIWPAETPNFDFTFDLFLTPMYNLFGGLTIAVVLFALLARFLPKSLFWNRMIMAEAIEGTSLDPEESTVNRPEVGDIGIAVSDLYPTGEIEIDGQHYEAKVEIGMIDKGARVRIVRSDTFNYSVEEANA